MAELYYIPPADELFEEVRAAALEIWGSYEEPYRSEKMARIKDISNVGDNFMYIVAMFDIQNQRKLGEKLSEEARVAIRQRMLDGGAELWSIPF